MNFSSTSGDHNFSSSWIVFSFLFIFLPYSRSSFTKVASNFCSVISLKIFILLARISLHCSGLASSSKFYFTNNRIILTISWAVSFFKAVNWILDCSGSLIIWGSNSFKCPIILSHFSIILIISWIKQSASGIRAIFTLCRIISIKSGY